MQASRSDLYNRWARKTRAALAASCFGFYRSSWKYAAGLLILFFTRTTAAAPLRAGVHVTGGYAEGAAAKVTGQLDFGINDSWSWRFDAGAAYTEFRSGAQILAGPVFAVDAFTYVPRLALLAGADIPTGKSRLQGGLELARYFSLHTGVSMGAYATWRPGAQVGALLAVGLEWEL